MMTATETMHPLNTGPDYEDEDGWQALYTVCPDCGQGEWWTQREWEDHGACRTAGGKCDLCDESNT